MGTFLSAPGGRAKLLILTYHRVLRVRDPLLDSTDEKAFSMQMAALGTQFNVLRLTEAAERLVKGTLPPRAVCVTFDDGYANNYDVALPILKKWNIPATFFIAVGFLNGGRMWNDTVIEAVRQAHGSVLDLRPIGLMKYQIDTDCFRRNTAQRILNELKYLPLCERDEAVANVAEIVGRPLPTDLMMTSEQVRALFSNGMEIGAHTVNHPILSRLSHDLAVEEIVQSRDYLSSMLNCDIDAFAYPNGRPGIDYSYEHVNAVRQAGFKLSVSTVRTYAQHGDSPHELPRISSKDSTALRFSARMLKNYFDGAARSEC